MLTELPAEQILDVVNDVARELLAEAGVDRPPVDALLVAKRLGLLVAQAQHSDLRASFVRLGQSRRSFRGTILLADDPRPERQQWAVAHEIGEFAAHQVFSQLEIDPEFLPPAERERMANHLANAILLPFEWFRADAVAVDWDLFELKQIYGTASHELIARRMLAMPPGVIISLFDQGKLVWRKSNVIRRPPPLVPAELSTWRTAYEKCQPTQYECQELPDGLRDIRCWPVHEPHWKREILRTALADW